MDETRGALRARVSGDHRQARWRPGMKTAQHRRPRRSCRSHPAPPPHPRPRGPRRPKYGGLAVVDRELTARKRLLPPPASPSSRRVSMVIPGGPGGSTARRLTTIRAVSTRRSSAPASACPGSSTAPRTRDPLQGTLASGRLEPDRRWDPVNGLRGEGPAPAFRQTTVANLPGAALHQLSRARLPVAVIDLPGPSSVTGMSSSGDRPLGSPSGSREPGEKRPIERGRDSRPYDGPTARESPVFPVMVLLLARPSS